MLSRSSASSITRSMYGLALAMLANSAAVSAALDFFERDGIALPGDAWALKCQDTQSRHTNPANWSTYAPGRRGPDGPASGAGRRGAPRRGAAGHAGAGARLRAPRRSPRRT